MYYGNDEYEFDVEIIFIALLYVRTTQNFIIIM